MNQFFSLSKLRRSGSLALACAFLGILAGCGGGSSSGGGGTGGGGGGTGNGRTFVFVSDRDGNLEIYRSRFDGTQQTRLTTEVAADLNPSLNRAGTAMVFSSERAGNREIYKLTLATNALQRFTEDPNPGVQDRSPVFSPDSSLIAWVSSRGGAPNVFVMDATGANQRQITTVTTGIGNSDVTWGPSNSEIAYVGTGAIVIRNISTGVERRVALDTANVSDLRWSPDGTKFLFTQTLLAPGSTNVSGSEIRVIDATTGAPITSGDAALRFTAGVANIQPSWSPDSQTVLWTARSDSALPFQIVSQSVAPGATPVPLTTIGGNTEPAWAE